MEQQIQDLVSSIRKEGIEEANKQSAEIVAKASSEAEKILTDAKKKAEKLVEDAKNECDLREQSSKAALAQAARDVSLELKKSIEEQFSRILSTSVSSAMDKSLLSRLVEDVVKAELKNVTIEVSGSDANAVVAACTSTLAKELKNGLAIKVGSSSTGLKISSNDGSGYFDLSAEETAELLKPYLSSALKAYIGL